MDSLRKPLFIIALVLLASVVLIEVGAGFVLKGDAPSLLALQSELPEDEDIREAFIDESEQYGELAEDVPGFGIPYLALIDGVLLFTVSLIAISLVVPEAVHSRVQGCATLIFSIVLIIAGIALIIAVIVAVTIMISLLLSVPFGTIAYFAIFGFFNRSGAAGVLSLLMALKIGFAACLLLSQQRFLQNKGLIFLILCSFLGNVIISFLHGFVPRFLVSITDAIAAILVAICGIIWLILLLIGSVPAVIKAIK